MNDLRFGLLRAVLAIIGYQILTVWFPSRCIVFAWPLIPSVPFGFGVTSQLSFSRPKTASVYSLQQSSSELLSVHPES